MTIAELVQDSVQPDFSRGGLGMFSREAVEVPNSLDEEARTVEYVLATETPVLRTSWRRGRYQEILKCSPENANTRRLASGRAPWLLSHRSWDVDHKVGTIVGFRFEGAQLIVRVRYDKHERAEEIWQRVRRGELPSCSVGYSVDTYQVTEHDDAPDVREAVMWEPYEGSLVTIGADHEAAERGLDSKNPRVETGVRLRGASKTMGDTKTSTQTKKQGSDDPKPQEGGERSKASETQGQPENAPDGEKTDSQRGGGDTLTSPAAPSSGSGGGISDQREASLEFIMGRAKVCGMSAKEVDEMHERKLTERQVVDELLKKKRAAAGPETSNQHDVMVDEITKVCRAAEAALLHRANESENKLPDEAKDLQGRSLMEIGDALLRARGIQVTGGRDERALAMLGLRHVPGMMSTADLPNILANVANKSLSKGYMEVPTQWSKVAREVGLPDFKDSKRVRLGGAPELMKLEEGGEIQVGTLSDSGETIALSTYARRIALTRQTLVNDDLGALTRTADAFGRRARALENRLVFEILANNPTMADGKALFHADHGNLITEALDEDGLEAAILAFAQQTAFDGEEIYLDPKMLLASPKNYRKAMQLLRIPTSPTTAGQSNVFEGMLEPVIVRELMKANGGDDWFVCCDPNMTDVIELAYLEGSKEPRFVTQPGFEVEGVQLKVTHDRSAKAIDHVGILKSVPA